ncbi:MAG: choice-of-anchor Q domain-containing protein [Thermomicrobiales bacterium]
MQPWVTGRRACSLRLGMIVALLGASLLAMLSATAVGAVSYTVTVNDTTDEIHPPTPGSTCSTSGTGVCSLRDAILVANTHPGASDLTTITLPAGAYQLTLFGSGEDNAATGDLDIKANVTINGGGASTTIIDGYNTSADPDRVFHVFGGFTVTFNNVTIQNGKATTSTGGGLLVASNATVTLTGCVVTGNTATQAAFGGGGGIFNGQSVLTLNGTTVSNNTALGSGGGLYNSFGTMVANNSIVSGNHAVGDGGGIFNFGGSLAVTNSTFTTNSVTGIPGLRGAGGAISATTSFSVAGSRFTGNTATGSIGGPGGTGGSASGGAVSNGTGTLTLMNSTFAADQAIGGGGGTGGTGGTGGRNNVGGNGGDGGTGGSGGGGGVSNGGTLTLTNSTFSADQSTGGIGGTGGSGGRNGNGGNGGNGGAGVAGAVFNTSSVTIVNATIAANSASGGGLGTGGTGSSPGADGVSGTGTGGGLANSGSQLRAINTLISANTGGTSANCSGAITDGFHNLEFNPAATCGFTALNDQHGNPNLDTLKSNGGPTQTMALLPGSVAKDTADPTACAAPPTSGKDQRGVARRSDRCSIGAFEADPAIPNTLPPSQPTGGGLGNPPPLPQARPAGSNSGIPAPLPASRP